MPALFGLGALGALLLASEGHCRPASAEEVSALRSELKMTREDLHGVRGEIAQQRKELREFWQKRPAFEADLSLLRGELKASSAECLGKHKAESVQREKLSDRLLGLETIVGTAKAYVAGVLFVLLGIAGLIFRQVRVEIRRARSDP